MIESVLSVLASTSAEVAIKYRSIQIQNRAQLDMLSPISVTTKTKLDAYVDTSDSIDISSDALEGKNKILNAKINLVTFISEVNETYGMIMDKWQAGPGRDTAQAAYDEFIAKAKDYSEILENVAQSITDALSNYSIIEQWYNMESSSYYAEKKSKFSQAKSSLVSCLGGISSTIDNIGKSSDKLSGVLICGESVGKDTLDKLSYIVNNLVIEDSL